LQSDPESGGESGIRGSGAHQVRGELKGRPRRRLGIGTSEQPALSPSRIAAVERRWARRVSFDAPPRLISADIFFGAALALHSFIFEGRETARRAARRPIHPGTQRWLRHGAAR